MSQYSRYPIINSGGSGGGTVTSVGLIAPSIFTVSGSPVTGSGTLAFSLNSEPANTFFAAPNGSSGNPSFRLIVPADIPTLNQNTTGTAANITATSNSTLTTLSSLSLPGSQVIGNIAGNAANITATSNSTLTTLSNLVSIGTITTGIWNGTVTAGYSFITSGTTYTTPSGITSATLFKFILIGGGGGSPGVTTTNGRGTGGGSGGGGMLFITGLSPSTAYTIAIGAAGTAGASSGTAGGSGGSTTLTIGATTYTAAGGGGGQAGVSTVGGDPGGAANCTINVAGQWGGWNFAANANSVAGRGGNSPFGFGLGGIGMGPNNFFGSSIAGTGYGAGGGGAANIGTAVAGAAGTQGCILVNWNN